MMVEEYNNAIPARESFGEPLFIQFTNSINVHYRERFKETFRHLYTIGFFVKRVLQYFLRSLCTVPVRKCEIELCVRVQLWHFCTEGFGEPSFIQYTNSLNVLPREIKGNISTTLYYRFF